MVGGGIKSHPFPRKLHATPGYLRGDSPSAQTYKGPQAHILGPASRVLESAPKQTRNSAQGFKVEGIVDSKSRALGYGLGSEPMTLGKSFELYWPHLPICKMGMINPTSLIRLS